MSKRPLRFMLKLVLFVVVLAIGGELAGLAMHYEQNESLFYSDRPHQELLAHEDVEETDLTRRRLHPVLGFISSEPGIPIKGSALVTNNYGYDSERGDYPFARENDDQFIVGIFGGSVASQFFQYGRWELIRRLKQHTALANKEIVVLSFAQAGYKQPQQLLSLAYFLSIGQEYDLVINLDGFNEVALSERNHFRGVATTLPSAGHMLQMMEISNQEALTPRKLEKLAQITTYRKDLDELAGWINANPSAIAHQFLARAYRDLHSTYKHALVAYDDIESRALEASLFYLQRSEPADDETLYSSLAAYWARCSIMMQTLLAPHGGAYLHCLQPNQYHTERVFSTKEAAIALNERHPYRAGAMGGYPALEQEFETLRAAGVDFYSCLDVLDDVTGIVYADDCCHFNARGISAIVESVSDHILANASLGTRPPN